MLPFNLPELEVSGLALVTAIDDCPPIACGEGSVVTARFVTREVHVVASVDVLGAGKHIQVGPRNVYRDKITGSQDFHSLENLKDLIFLVVYHLHFVGR
jgi:hypothetical protein